MVQIDKETLEYLKSNLEREIRESVEGKLFSRWRAYSLIFLAGVGVVGVPWALTFIDAKIASSVSAIVKEKVEGPMKQAQQSAQEGHATVQDMRDRVSKTLGEVEARRGSIDEALADMKTKARAGREEILGIASSLKDARAELDGLIDQTAQLSHRVRNTPVPDAAAVAASSENVEKLAQEVQRMGAQLKIVAERAGATAVAADVAGDAERLSSLTASAAASARSAQPTPAAPDQTGTVYLQFAQMKREDARSLSARLKIGGWNVPGEERLDSAQGLKEIRCFYEADCARATGLQRSVEAALDQLGFGKVPVAIKPRLNFSPKPRPGIVELWLGVESPSSR